VVSVKGRGLLLYRWSRLACPEPTTVISARNKALLSPTASRHAGQAPPGASLPSIFCCAFRIVCDVLKWEA